MRLYRNVSNQVVSMASVAASGGYLTALGADVSLAQETSITGSIGVIMARPAIHNFLKQHGLNPQESMSKLVALRIPEHFAQSCIVRCLQSILMKARNC
jgi:ClpP class serine protease